MWGYPFRHRMVAHDYHRTGPTPVSIYHHGRLLKNTETYNDCLTEG